MARIIEVSSLEAPELQVYASLTEAQLRNRLCPDRALFIAESPKVISVALDAGYEPVSMLCERKHITGDATPIIARCPEGMPVYTAEREVLASLTGYTLTRGVLCALRRRPEPQLEQIVASARRVAVIAGVVDTTNIGAIFRAAAALGIDAVVVTRQSCDPLNRRSVRTSMGSVFLVPWTWVDDANAPLQALGFKTVAMALTDRSVGINNAELCAEPKLAIILGTEGDGLPVADIEAADYTARIPMAHGVDSLNVACAASVAFWQLTRTGL